MPVQRPSQLAAQRRAARKAHFAAGLTPAMWLPAQRRLADRRKAAQKLACRGARDHRDTDSD